MKDASVANKQGTHLSDMPDQDGAGPAKMNGDPQVYRGHDDGPMQQTQNDHVVGWTRMLAQSSPPDQTRVQRPDLSEDHVMQEAYREDDSRENGTAERSSPANEAVAIFGDDPPEDLPQRQAFGSNRQVSVVDPPKPFRCFPIALSHL